MLRQYRRSDSFRNEYNSQPSSDETPPFESAGRCCRTTASSEAPGMPATIVLLLEVTVTKSGYATLPCSLTSSPSISSSGDTRTPRIASMIFQTISETRKTKTPTPTTPASCAIKIPAPPPKNRPLPVVLGVNSACANKPTQIVPKMPQTKCPEVAPPGSSIFTLSKNRTDNTTNAPATKPIISELGMLTKAQGAVIATSPANAPLSIIVRSGLPRSIQAVMD